MLQYVFAQEIKEVNLVLEGRNFRENQSKNVQFMKDSRISVRQQKSLRSLPLRFGVLIQVLPEAPQPGYVNPIISP